MLLQAGLADSTRKKYQSKLSHYLRFCQSQNIKPLSATNDTIYMYVCWRFKNDNQCTVGVIKSEINAIQSWHVDNRIHLSVLGWKPIDRLLDGFKKLRSSKSNVKAPLSADQFQKMLKNLPSVSHDTQLLRAALCWEQNGFARSAEYTMKSNSSISKRDLENAVSLNNLRFGRNSDGSHYMIYKQYHSKTNQFGKEESKIFSCRCPGPCAIKEVKALLRMRTNNKSSDYLFRFANGKFLTYNNVNNAVKNLCAAAGYDPAQFGTHSLRKGAAVDAVEDGLDVVQVMKVGGWKSINGFQPYPVLSDEQLCQLRRDKFTGKR